jgi:tRNA pseudouridine38-40 synthase
MLSAYVSTCLLTIAYDGTHYAGWQRQLGESTVQEALERALTTIFGTRVPVEGSGRTDAGVHAFGQAAHVVLPKPFLLPKLVPALNGNLPDDISVRSVRPAPEGFHARFCAIGKRYVYRCVTSKVRPAVGRGYYHWVRRPLDLQAMRRAGRLLIGRHDFASFATNPGYERKRGTVRTLRHVQIVQRSWGFDLAVQGDGFLYNMVRTIAGTLIDVGSGRRSVDQFGEILRRRDRREAGPTAPACGLYLLSVLYPDPLVKAAACTVPGDPLS